MEAHECILCNKTLCLPLVFPCGHSGACASCVLSKVPTVRNCTICGKRSKTMPKKLPINKTLDLVLRKTFPSSFTDKPAHESVAADLILTEMLRMARSKAEEFRGELTPFYLGEYESVIERHAERASTCRCGLFVVPQKKRDSERRFYGCPRWKPTVGNVKTGCGFWRWLSVAEGKIEDAK